MRAGEFADGAGGGAVIVGEAHFVVALYRAVAGDVIDFEGSGAGEVGGAGGFAEALFLGLVAVVAEGGDDPGGAGDVLPRAGWVDVAGDGFAGVGAGPADGAVGIGGAAGEAAGVVEFGGPGGDVVVIQTAEGEADGVAAGPANAFAGGAAAHGEGGLERFAGLADGDTVLRVGGVAPGTGKALPG